MSSKGIQFTIRLDEKINSEIVGRAKEMDIAPIPGVLEVEMRYGNNIMRTRVQR